MKSEYLNEPKNFIYAAKRLNNAQRRHLYVNAYQAKHIPVRGDKALALFDKLAEKLREETAGGKLLIIGFAETATAIGARLAEKASPDGYFVTTTRESEPGEEYIEFSESHSHAKRQLLSVRGLEEAVYNSAGIVFAEDEITTGKTIEKLIYKLKERFPNKKLKFGIAAALDSLSKERERAVDALGIKRVSLYKIPQNWRAEELNKHNFGEESIFPANTELHRININYADSPYVNQRIVHSAEKYSKAADLFAEEAVSRIFLSGKDCDILILGTEEFMYPAVLAASKLSEKYPEKNILTHSTTRSPIEVSGNENYPLFNRTPIVSLYESGRENYIYNLNPYDKVFVFTDAKPGGAFGEFAASLAKTGAEEAELFVWGKKMGAEH